MQSRLLLAVMQRIVGLAASPEMSVLAGCRSGLCAWRTGPSGRRQPALQRQWAGASASPVRPFTGAAGRGLCRRRVVFVGQKLRLFCSQPGADGPAGSSGPRPPISVVGIPDPITWIRCKVVMYLVHLYFELDLHSAEFDRGVKQALVHVSEVMSSGRYHQLRGIVSNEMVEHIEKSCRSLTEAQRQQLAVNVEDIIFLIPEDVSVVYDQYGRKFCFVVMRFWLLTAHEGPEDPEATHIFRVASSEDGSPQKKIATAVYEFHRELTRGASPDWTVTTVWHWHWTLAK
ncbi:m-AAA protease-interacting protein 1, mitochondrial [Hippoglossus hippoglossus]|uniref:m-AAA protease-interacting protein 1, mitochondrial n=1 Tax=Hippoglossus hippoglossus TaxID=8267 RepID=UPI00148DE7D7|nr:m-AAA protease-interacting protein 1, mitochondrial [Hippoglossus hippoglossus]